MPPGLRTQRPPQTRSLTLLTKPELAAWLRRAPAARRRFIEQSGFGAGAGEIALLAGNNGAITGALAGIGGTSAYDDLWTVAGLAQRLPAGSYALDPEPPPAAATRAAIGWALGAYAFTRYARPRAVRPSSCWPPRADRAAGRAHGGRGDPGARPRQHAGRGHGAGGARRRRGRAGRAARRRRCASSSATSCCAQNYPADPRRRPRQHAARRG